MSEFIPLKHCYAPPRATALRRLLYFFARRSYARHLQKHYRIQHSNADFLRELQAPYILLANHVTDEDPFIYNILCPYPISWVIGKSLERDSCFPSLWRTLRCISRSKEMSDLDTVRKIHRWIAEGEVVGIFPEGQTSFSGLSHPIPEATAKLLRLLKVPVVALRNEGGYFARPRWAYQRRCSPQGRGPGIHLHYELLFDQDQIQAAGLSEIVAKVKQALHYDPYRAGAFVPQLDLGLRRQNLAESMELLFYACLLCQGLGMQSRGMELRCGNCGAIWQISTDSRFLRCGAQHYHLEQYYQGQLQLLQKRAAAGNLQVQQAFARLRCYRGKHLECREPGGLVQLDAAGLLLQQKGRTLYHFPVRQVFASHVFRYNTWEFHTRAAVGQLFVVEFPRKSDSAFLLLDSLKALQQLWQPENSS